MREREEAEERQKEEKNGQEEKKRTVEKVGEPHLCKHRHSLLFLMPLATAQRDNKKVKS